MRPIGVANRIRLDIIENTLPWTSGLTVACKIAIIGAFTKGTAIPMMKILAKAIRKKSAGASQTL